MLNYSSPRTNRVSGQKSHVLKPTFLAENDGEKWSRFFHFQILLVAPLEIPAKGPFKYYVIKEVGGCGQKMATFDDLQYCKSSKNLMT